MIDAIVIDFVDSVVGWRSAHSSRTALIIDDHRDRDRQRWLLTTIAILIGGAETR